MSTPRTTRRRIIARAPQLNLGRFYTDTRSEIRKISWPSRDETIRLSIVVIALSVSLALFLGLLVDTVFFKLYNFLIGL